MAYVRKLSLVVCLFGLILYLPSAKDWLTLHFGQTAGQFSGLVSFIVGWSVLGAGMAFSAGAKFQRSRVKKKNP
jgi:hypothetical protein